MCWIFKKLLLVNNDVKPHFSVESEQF